MLTVLFILSKPVSTHSRTKAAAAYLRVNQPELFVSTHSRTKAAAPQPPSLVLTSTCFNTQPHEGGCDYDIKHRQWDSEVSTHSRTKAAAQTWEMLAERNIVSTHSRTKAAALV